MTASDRSRSRYFATAEKMDEALLFLLERKDLAYITVKEICETAGVNRSTYYLHYETIADLLAETVQYVNRIFLESMECDSVSLVARLRTCPRDELYFVTPTYLTPYLEFVSRRRRLFRTVIRHARVLEADEAYERMFRQVFAPILERFGVEEGCRPYYMAFYIKGLIAIVSEWIERDCADSPERIIEVMQRCVGAP